MLELSKAAIDQIKVNIALYSKGQFIGNANYSIQTPFAHGLDIKTLATYIETRLGDLNEDGELEMAGTNDF